MAPALDIEESKPSKRKRDSDDLDKAKHAKRHRSKDANQPVNGNGVNGNSDENNHDADVSAEMIEPLSPGATTPRKSKGNKKDRAKRRQSKADGSRDAASEDTAQQTSAWKVSQPIGGRILDIDPILTEDEEHVVLAYNTSVQVYSTKDSLLVRKVQLPLSRDLDHPESIVAVRLSPSTPTTLWVASSAGRIWKIDWTSGEGTSASMRLKCDFLIDLTVEPLRVGKKHRDVLFISLQADQASHLLACDVDELNLVASKLLFSGLTPIENLRSVEGGLALTASSGVSLVVGTSNLTVASSFDDWNFEFFTLDCSDEITCLDIRASERVHLSRRTQREQGNEPVVDVVLGCARGAIFIYSDMIPQLRVLHRAESRSFSLQPRKYHWHRKAVHAVKWSQDGNYTISGGSETVLALRQLDTEKMDFLPHLSATIENIVVSRNGSSYVVHLDDNSVMILSTAEMKPTTYISGIQTLVIPRPLSKDDVVRRVGQIRATSLPNIPMAVNPSNPSRMLLCVGNGQQASQSGSDVSAPLVQMLDVTTLQSISKQPLTRTNATDINVNSKGHPVIEPKITHMAYSMDGKWLATLDEWKPSLRDVEPLEVTPSERSEVYLKFWTASKGKEGASEDKEAQKDDSRLELATRINTPHHGRHCEAVFDLTADPSSHRFATVGEDGIVRLWQPRIRQRDGVVVKSRTGRQLESWACSRTIPLHENRSAVYPYASDDDDIAPSSGAVAFSQDGSTLACAFSDGQESTVCIIDPESGEIRISLSGLSHGLIQGIQILSSKVIVLSEDLVVYDIVSNELSYGITLAHGVASSSKSLSTHLAVDHRSQTFAVALARDKSGSSKSRSDFAIFSVETSVPLMVHKFPHPIVSVAPSSGSSGYLLLDAAAQLWSVSEGTGIPSIAIAQPLADVDLDAVDGAPVEDGPRILAVLGDEDEGASEDEMEVDEANDDDGGDQVHPAVVPPQKLAELFDAAPAFAMPPIEDMFYKVTQLFSTQQTTNGSA